MSIFVPERILCRKYNLVLIAFFSFLFSAVFLSTRMLNAKISDYYISVLTILNIAQRVSATLNLRFVKLKP